MRELSGFRPMRDRILENSESQTRSSRVSGWREADSLAMLGSALKDVVSHLHARGIAENGGERAEIDPTA